MHMTIHIYSQSISLVKIDIIFKYIYRQHNIECYKKLSHGEITVQTYCLPKRTNYIKCYLPTKAVNNKATTE